VLHNPNRLPRIPVPIILPQIILPKFLDCKNHGYNLDQVTKTNSIKLLKRLFWTIALLIFGAIVIPNFIRARNTSAQNACLNNLRLIDGAKQQWQLENRKTESDIATSSDLQPYLG
jgi:hypothetical protein